MPPAGAPLPMSNLTSPPPMPPFPMLLVDLPRWRRHAREREVPSIIWGRLRLRRRLGYMSAHIFGCLTDAELRCLEVRLPGADDVASLTTAAWAATTSYEDATFRAAAAWAAAARRPTPAGPLEEPRPPQLHTLIQPPPSLYRPNSGGIESL